MERQKLIVQLVNRYHKLLLRYAIRIIQNDVAAYEAVSKAFLRLYNDEKKSCEKEIRKALMIYTREACHGWLHNEITKLIVEKKIPLNQLQQIKSGS